MDPFTTSQVSFIKKYFENEYSFDINDFINSANDVYNQQIYTDGACFKNGKRGAKTGCGVYFQNTGKEVSYSLEEAIQATSYKGELNSTNNVGELMAILCALCLATPGKKLVIYSDSEYSINCITDWYKKWEKNNWIASAGSPVKNKELIQRILSEKEKFQVEFKHIKSHTAEPQDKNSDEYIKWYGNFKADELACRGLAK